MKTYLFNPETHVFVGEYFVEGALLKSIFFVIPSNVTTVAPPVGGLVLEMVFDADCTMLGSPFTVVVRSQRDTYLRKS